MKVKLFVSAKQAEVRLPEGGKSIVKKAKESLEAFKERAIKEITEDNLVEEASIQVSTVDAEAVKKFSVEQITEQYLKEADNQKSAKFALLKEALEEREVELPEIPKAEKPAKAEKAPKEPKAPKAPRVPKEVEAFDIEELKLNIGKVAKFKQHGKEETEGSIVGVSIDKKKGAPYYKLKLEDGTCYKRTIAVEIVN